MAKKKKLEVSPEDKKKSEEECRGEIEAVLGKYSCFLDCVAVLRPNAPTQFLVEIKYKG